MNLDRRHFVKGSAALAAAFTLPHAQAADKIKISDNEENLNAFELKEKQADGVKVVRNDDRIGEVKFYRDRGKVKVKDNGFKIYRNDEVEVLRVKIRPTQQELFSADDRQLGHLANDGAGSAIGTSTISVVAEQGLLVVRRDQDIAAKVPKSVGPRAAAWLAVLSRGGS